MYRSLRTHRVRYPKRFIIALYHVAGMTEDEALDLIELHRQGMSGEGDIDLLSRAASSEFRAKVRMNLPRIVADNLWLCQDCVVADINGDYAGLSAERANEVCNGLQQLAARYGGTLAPDFDANSSDGIHEFSWRQCDACGTQLGGYRARYIVVKR
mgnify:CR=1 FL=1